MDFVIKPSTFDHLYNVHFLSYDKVVDLTDHTLTDELKFGPILLSVHDEKVKMSMELTLNTLEGLCETWVQSS